ncbi:MAG: hypothetical protein OER88_05375 [Planctomycetota bacterium]|nr:hypothetical protein [Planctomycetota bacterium]
MTGIIAEADQLRSAGALEEYESAWLRETFAWFNERLPVPPFPRSWPRDAVCWFKADAGDAIHRMWGLVSFLREHGMPVRLLRARCPGRILYEDRYQVVVDEWKRI